MKNICLLGATGSIGLQTIDIIGAHKEKFRLYALAFGKNIEKALPIIKKHEPKIIVVQDNNVRKMLLAESLNHKCEILIGQEGMIAISEDPQTDIVVNAVMGSVGLPATIAAIKKRKQIAIANKETLVTAGHIVMDLAKKNGVHLLPVDSEHSAIFQSLNGEKSSDIHKVILTASGGSFRDKKRDELVGVTVEDALNHPNWSMGAKITIDSASMMNKGLEVIEAHWLFDIAYKDIEVLLHKESVIHSMIEFQDKSVMAQLGTPDMRIPIQYALTYPDREAFAQSKRLDLAEISTLHFAKMDMERFPCLAYAFKAGEIGGSMPTVLNAANEAAVDLFLNGKITFLEIEKVIESSMENHQVINEPNLETIINIDQETRQRIYHRY